MGRFQCTLWQLDDYGPWTTTPGPRPEMRLQALQSRLYADLAEAVGRRDGYVFRAREDNLVGVTNGLDRAAHAAVRDELGDYPVSVSAGVGVGETPVAALASATRHLQTAGSAQDPDRRRVLRGEFLDGGPAIQVAHFDVASATARLTDAVDAAAATDAVTDAAGALRRRFREVHDGLAYFVGGDNVIVVTRPLAPAAYRAACEAVADETGLELRVGVGEGTTPVAAGMDAKHALETAREDDRVTVTPESTAAGD